MAHKPRQLSPVRPAVLLLLCATYGFGADVRVRIHGSLPSSRVVLQLFDSADSFSGLRSPVRVERDAAVGPGEYRIGGVKPGQYALVAYSDENANGKLDRNFLGIPVEPIGFSCGYRPKGPPRYHRAQFAIADSDVDMELVLSRPLGKRGRVGVGVGVLAQSSPYRAYKGQRYQVIPAITYVGKRLQVLGPRASFSLASVGGLRCALTARYELGAYEEDDSPALDGMGDRRDTMMLGLAATRELPAGLSVMCAYEHDVLGRIGGGQAKLSVRRSFEVGRFGIAPVVGATWMGSDLAGHYYGVTEGQARAGRPAYRPGGVVNPRAGISVFLELSRSWQFICAIDGEWLSPEITHSPIVDEDVLVGGFAALNCVL